MRYLILLLLLMDLTTDALAGPLLDRLRERRAQQANLPWGAEADATSGAKLPPGARVLRDVAYGNDPAQRLDVYLPAHPTGAPAILMVHGGAWRIGDKGMSRVVDNKVARWLPRGSLFVSVNYRMLPRANPQQQAEDVALALAYAQAHAGGWGGDPAAFILMGHSAGAHLVSLINSQPSLAKAAGAQPWLGTVSLDTAAMDNVATMQTRHYRFYDQAFGDDPAFWQATSPMQQLHPDAPPLLAVCSSTRPDHPCAATHAYADKAHGMGLRVEVLEQPFAHSEINARLGMPGGYTEAVEAFMASLAPRLPDMFEKPSAR